MTRLEHFGFCLALGFPLALGACFSDPAPSASSDETSGDGDGDPATGDGDGDPATGDGDGDATTTTGDGDGDPTGDGDGDATGDGDGDATGDGDGEPAEGWQWEIEISFANDVLTDGLTDFPVLVLLNPGRIDYEEAKADGADLRFFDRDNNPLPHEIEHWEPGGESFVWVKVSEIDANDDFFVMRYGNPTAPEAEDAPAVWSRYLAVWHLADNPASELVVDSTGNHNGSLSEGNDVSSGQGPLAAGMIFDGNEAVLVEPDAALDLTDSVSIESWVNPLETATFYRHILSKGGANSPYTLQASNIGTDAESVLTIRNQGIGAAAAVPHVPPGEWTYFAGTYDEDAIRVYVNGMPGATADLFGPMKVNVEPVDIGRQFVGSLDEIRIAAEAFNQDYIRVQNRSMRDQLLSFSDPMPL